MQGVNKMTINNATMRDIVARWLNEDAFTQAIPTMRVVNIEQTDELGSFKQFIVSFEPEPDEIDGMSD